MPDAVPWVGTAGSGALALALTTAIALVRPRGAALAKAGAHFTKHELTNRAVRRAGQGRAGDSNSGRLGEFAKREAAKTLCGGS